MCIRDRCSGVQINVSISHNKVQKVSICFYKFRWVGGLKSLPERVITSFVSPRMRCTSLFIDLSMDWDDFCTLEDLYCVSFGSLATESLLWCWTWGLAITGLWLFVGGRWFLGLGGSPCGDCSPWFRGGIGSFVKRNGWAGDAISLLRSECSVWRPVYWDQGRKVSPRKSMVQSASQ